MSNFTGRPPFSNSQWVGIETMQFHIAQTKLFEDTFVSHPGGPNEQFGTHEKLSLGGGGGGGVQGNLNWMLGYTAVVEVQKMFSSLGGLLINAMYHHGETLNQINTP